MELVTAGSDVRVWRIQTKQATPPRADLVYAHHAQTTTRVTAVAWTGVRGQVIVSAGHDGRLVLSKRTRHDRGATTVQSLQVLRQGTAPATCLATTATAMLAGTDDGVVSQWTKDVLHPHVHRWDEESVVEMAEAPPTQQRALDQGPVTAMATSRTGRLVAAAQAGTIHVLERTSLENKTQLAAHPVSPVMAATFSLHDDTTVFAASQDGVVRVWDVESSHRTRPVASFPGYHATQATAIACSAAAPFLLVSGGQDKRLCFFDTRQKHFVKQIVCDWPVSCLSWHRHGALLAVGTNAGHVLVFDLAAERVAHRIIGAHTQIGVHDVAFNNVRVRRPPPAVVDARESASFAAPEAKRPASAPREEKHARPVAAAPAPVAVPPPPPPQDPAPVTPMAEGSVVVEAVALARDALMQDMAALRIDLRRDLTTYANELQVSMTRQLHQQLVHVQSLLRNETTRVATLEKELAAAREELAQYKNAT